MWGCSGFLCSPLLRQKCCPKPYIQAILAHFEAGTPSARQGIRSVRFGLVQKGLRLGINRELIADGQKPADSLQIAAFSEPFQGERGPD